MGSELVVIHHPNLSSLGVGDKFYITQKVQQGVSQNFIEPSRLMIFHTRR